MLSQASFLKFTSREGSGGCCQPKEAVAGWCASHRERKEDEVEWEGECEAVEELEAKADGS